MSWSLRLATFNLHNFAVESTPGRLHRLARLVVEQLGAPDILAVQELAAEAGDTPTVSGKATAQALIEAIHEAGGPRYSYLEVAPRVNADGGQVGRNIRVGFLYDPRVAEFAPRSDHSDDPHSTVSIHHGQTPQLYPNPGRIAPLHPAFCGDPERSWQPSRKALTGEFQVASEPLYLVNCHLKSMRSQGRRAALHARKQRHAQAELIAHFVRSLLSCQAEARLVVLGDLNDGINSRTLEIIRQAGLHNALEKLPPGLCHTSTHGGKLQTLDHLLISPALEIGDVHVIHQRRLGIEPPVSDHDPVLVTLRSADSAAMTHRDEPQAQPRNAIHASSTIVY